MLSRSDALEVALVPDSGLCSHVELTVKARGAAGGSLLCCLNVDGKLMICDVCEPGAPVHLPEDSYT
ncbi:spatacsin, partial [Tachysurus ichikawai]